MDHVRSKIVRTKDLIRSEQTARDGIKSIKMINNYYLLLINLYLNSYCKSLIEIQMLQ